MADRANVLSSTFAFPPGLINDIPVREEATSMGHDTLMSWNIDDKSASLCSPTGSRADVRPSCPTV